MNRNRKSESSEKLGQRIILDPLRPRVSVEYLLGLDDKVRVTWSNDESKSESKSKVRGFFTADGFVRGYAIDGEERDCLVLRQTDHPDFSDSLLFRSIVVSQVSVVQVLITDTAFPKSR